MTNDLTIPLAMVTFNFGGNVLCMVEGLRDAQVADVLATALVEQRRYDRECSTVRLAELEELPPKWGSNPVLYGERAVWLVVCVWIYWDDLDVRSKRLEVCDEL